MFAVVPSNLHHEKGLTLRGHRLFGQLIIAYCFKFSRYAAYQDILPVDYRHLCSFTLELLEEFAPFSPAIAKYAEIASILCQGLM